MGTLLYLLCFLECFLQIDNTGWVTERASGPQKNMHQIPPKSSPSGQVDKEKQEGPLVNPGSAGKCLSKWNGMYVINTCFGSCLTN